MSMPNNLVDKGINKDIWLTMNLRHFYFLTAARWYNVPKDSRSVFREVLQSYYYIQCKVVQNLPHFYGYYIIYKGITSMFCERFV